MAKKKSFREKYGIVRADEIAPPKYTPTGFSRMDNCRGEPDKIGLLQGGITVIYGKTGAGKSTFTYQAIAGAQRQPGGTDKRKLVVDVENSFSPNYAKQRGMDLENVDILPVPDFIDTAFEVVRQAIASGEYDMVIVDSIHGQAANRDIKGDRSLEEEKAVGALPMKITQFIQVTKATVARTGVVLILIGQARDNMEKYGDPIHLTGGNALKHDADLILQMTPSTSSSRCNGIIPKDSTGQFDGHIAMVKVEKCRGRGMGRRFDMPFLKEEGFSEERCLIEECATTDWGKEIFNTKANSSHYKWIDAEGEEVKLHGKAKLLQYFQGNAEELKRLQEKVVEATSPIAMEEEEAEVDEPAGTV